MSIWNKYLLNHIEVGSTIADNQIEDLYKNILETIENERQIFTFGNGGSASTANHLSADLSLLGIRTGRNCKSINLNSDLSLTTALANDISYEDVIARQLEIFAEEGDLVISYSASGNSKNILMGLKKSLELNLKSWAILGFDGGQTKLVQGLKIIHFQSPRDYGTVENLHLSLNHFIIDKIVDYYRDLRTS